MPEMLSSLLGALVGGLLSLLGVHWATARAEKQAEADRWRSLRGLLRAVRAELDLSWSHPVNVKGAEISRAEEPIPFRIRLGPLRSGRRSTWAAPGRR